MANLQGNRQLQPKLITQSEYQDVAELIRRVAALASAQKAHRTLLVTSPHLRGRDYREAKSNLNQAELEFTMWLKWANCARLSEVAELLAKGDL